MNNYAEECMRHYSHSDAPKVKPGDYIRVFDGASGKWLDGIAKSLPKEKTSTWWIEVSIGNRDETAVWSGEDFILGRV
jgi:hypothetical protein